MSTAQAVLNMVRHAVNPDKDVFGVLNQSIRSVAKRLYLLKSKILQNDLSVSITTGDDYGDLPSGFWGLVDFPYLSGENWRLKPLPNLTIKLSYTGDGIPVYYQIKGTKIYITPSTASDYTIVGDYFAKPTEITAVGDTLPFDELFDDIIDEFMRVYFAKPPSGTVLMRLYLMNEIDLVAGMRDKKAPYHMNVNTGIDWGAH